MKKTARRKIREALAEKLKLIDGTGSYSNNLYNNVFPTLKFWDEVNNFPSIYMSAGVETREYLPADFTWANLAISIKIYCKGESPEEELESILGEVETVISNNEVLVYDTENGKTTTEILVTSITTDEGQLHPFAVGEINIIVTYAL